MEIVMEQKLGEKDLDRQINYYKVEQNSAVVFLDKLLRGQNKSVVTMVKLRRIGR